jgi:hypothetical protein
MATACDLSEQALGHYAAAGVRDADEQDVHAGFSLGSTGAISVGRACSTRTN